jgi:ABC-type branched-subunit amino acid transport system ATPase component
MTRTFQINTLFPGLTALESMVLARCEHSGRGAVWWRTAAAERTAIDEAREILARLSSIAMPGRSPARPMASNGCWRRLAL